MVAGLKVGHETLVSDKSGRNANGDSFIDVVNKKYKIYVTLRHTLDDEMKLFMNTIEPYVVNVQFRNPKTKALTTITAYTGTPEPEYFTIQPNYVLYKPLSLNFVEL